MKAIIISAVMLLLTVAFATASSAITVAMLDSVIVELGEAESAEDYKQAMEHADQREFFLSLTLPDSSLSEISVGIRELATLAEEGKADEIGVTKGRLLCQIEHQRRLSGFNARSIF